MDKEILDVMACLKCKSALTDEGEFLKCFTCNIGYPIKDDIPHMLEESIFSLDGS
ncbi:Trm112 family protein [Gammaproteobacteria bacterium]|nr:Trm112 family protein [Gammaproteobacteria bacterium]